MTETLSSERICLRPLRPSDAGPIQLFASDLRVAQMTTSIPHPYPPGGAEAFIASSQNGRKDDRVWAIDATPDGGAEFVGVISLVPARFEIGYWVGPPFWNTGRATEALSLLADRILSHDAPDRLTARVFKDNLGSQRVLSKVGFQPLEESESFSVARGAVVPSVIYALDRRDWQEHHADLALQS